MKKDLNFPTKMIYLIFKLTDLNFPAKNEQNSNVKIDSSFQIFDLSFQNYAFNF